MLSAFCDAEKITLLFFFVFTFAEICAIIYKYNYFYLKEVFYNGLQIL